MARPTSFLQCLLDRHTLDKLLLVTGVLTSGRIENCQVKCANGADTQPMSDKAPGKRSYYRNAVQNNKSMSELLPSGIHIDTL